MANTSFIVILLVVSSEYKRCSNNHWTNYYNSMLLLHVWTIKNHWYREVSYCTIKLNLFFFWLHDLKKYWRDCQKMFWVGYLGFITPDFLIISKSVYNNTGEWIFEVITPYFPASENGGKQNNFFPIIELFSAVETKIDFSNFSNQKTTTLPYLISMS